MLQSALSVDSHSLHGQHEEAPRGEEVLVGQSLPIHRLRKQIESAARVRSTVVIEGETGTGKGLAARLIHGGSPFRNRPFIHVDCAALSPSLIESELFGHERGAFTGAGVLRRGRFELAAEGTIFLDEIGELDAGLQSKLLRVLEDRAFERVGGTHTLPMRARVIAATSRELRQSVSNGSFRADLFYRLSVLHIHVAPLRERPTDIPLLAEATIQRLARSLGLPVPLIPEGFHARLLREPWRGNVRELMNVLEQALVSTAKRELCVRDLEEILSGRAVPDSPDVRCAGELENEIEMVRSVLIRTGGNVTRAARCLQVPRGTLRYRIHKHGLDDLIPKD